MKDFWIQNITIFFQRFMTDHPVFVMQWKRIPNNVFKAPKNLIPVTSVMNIRPR